MVLKSIVTFFICLIPFCGQPFEVINATSQKYMAGRKESGGGINYKIELVALKSSKKLKFESFEVDGKRMVLKIQNSQKQFIKEFSKEDTLVLSATISFTPGEMSELNNVQHADVVLNYFIKRKKGEVWLSPKIIQPKHYK